MNMNKYERLNWQKKYNSLNSLSGKKRVAAYCRVSTEKEEQAQSFESQCEFFRCYIEGRKEWEFYKVFADEGISGTSTKKREQFNRMIEEARQGKFDLLLTKEISRFARNTLDSIYYTRELRKVGVGLLFLNDGINTLEGDAELRLSIMASIAQEESRKTSERVKWGQKRRMEEGVVFGRSMLGYDVKNGKMYVNEEGAKVVRKDKISDFLAQPEITVMKKTKRSEKEIDIRPFIYKMELQGDKIFMMLASASANYTKPELVTDTFFSWLGIELPEFAYSIKRLEVYADKGTEEEHKFVTLEALGEEVE